MQGIPGSNPGWARFFGEHFNQPAFTNTLGALLILWIQRPKASTYHNIAHSRLKDVGRSLIVRVLRLATPQALSSEGLPCSTRIYHNEFYSSDRIYLSVACLWHCECPSTSRRHLDHRVKPVNEPRKEGTNSPLYSYKALYSAIRCPGAHGQVVLAVTVVAAARVNQVASPEHPPIHHWARPDR